MLSFDYAKLCLSAESASAITVNHKSLKQAFLKAAELTKFSFLSHITKNCNELNLIVHRQRNNLKKVTFRYIVLTVIRSITCHFYWAIKLFTGRYKTRHHYARRSLCDMKTFTPESYPSLEKYGG